MVSWDVCVRVVSGNTLLPQEVTQLAACSTVARRAAAVLTLKCYPLHSRNKSWQLSRACLWHLQRQLNKATNAAFKSSARNFTAVLSEGGAGAGQFIASASAAPASGL